MPNVIIRAGETQPLDVALGIAVEQQQVTVTSEAPGAELEVNPAVNASVTILEGEDLEALPDDPDELQQDLLALAGPSVGPNGGQIYIDGFSNATLPPKSAIREIRINQNPFSAEYDKPGYGRIEVFTKPGSAQWHGLASFNENNSVFNSRNPYVLDGIPPYHSEFYNGYLSGSMSKRLSVFLNAERRDITELGAVAAIPDVLPEGAAVPSPRRRLNLSTRFDYQLTPGNTLTALYMYLNNDQENLGIGGPSGLALPSQGYNSKVNEHTLQISDTQILSPHAINETRFQFIQDETDQSANQSSAALNVVGEFLGGGNTIGQSSETVHGIFYDRFTEDLVLQAERLNGVLEQQTVFEPAAGASIACSPGTLPPGTISASNCNTSASTVSSSPTIYQINPKLRAPYTMQSAVSVERQLGSIGTLSVTYLNSRGFHQLITQNVNAPAVPFVDASRPLFSQFGTDNIYQYNSDAFFNQNQLVTNFRIRLSRKISLFGSYALGWVNSNTGGANSSPSNQLRPKAGLWPCLLRRAAPLAAKRIGFVGVQRSHQPVRGHQLRLAVQHHYRSRSKWRLVLQRPAGIYYPGVHCR